ncbi:FHA domain-containing protein [Nakamurella lactea]|uniref:FHA domain-containing protein n=1 Tax=Nakamurella lactea TaxID=459515 RepID=UPI0004230486|nr:FHA domain-containing protein [Nakamurella lactea]
MTEQERAQTDESAAATTSVFQAVPNGELEKPGEQTLTGLEALRPGTALLVVKRGPNAGSRFQLDKQLVSAGRHPESEIFLDDVTVSRRHAEFRQVGDGFEVSDVGSLNGTYVNREPIETTTLANGDEVQIGKFRLVFLTAGDDAGPVESDTAQDVTGHPAS